MKENTLTQYNAVKKLFKTGRWFDAIDVFEYTGSMRLSARIFQLKKEGMKFEKKIVKFTTRFGTKGFYYRFRLVK
jgi:hypothetical protein